MLSFVGCSRSSPVESTSCRGYVVSVQLVAVLRKHKMRVRLKDARETFAAKFPMHEHLWLDWISDALAEAAGGRMQYLEVVLLAQRALLDYHTASLWRQFLEYGPVFLQLTILLPLNHCLLQCSF